MSFSASSGLLSYLLFVAVAGVAEDASRICRHTGLASSVPWKTYPSTRSKILPCVHSFRVRGEPHLNHAGLRWKLTDFGPGSLFAFKVAFELVFRDEPILFKDAVRQLGVQPGKVAFPNLERPALADVGELMSVANIRIACRKKFFPRTCRDLTRRGVSSSRRRRARSRSP